MTATPPTGTRGTSPAAPARFLAVALGVAAGSASAVTAPPEAAIEIARLHSEVVVDGDLSDAAWRDAVRIDSWYETNPGDNVAPQVANVGYLGYDDRFFYAAFEFQDPEPSRIRAPLADRDDVPSFTDYGGVILDATDDRQTAQMFLANARGIQYDAISSDAAGEDSAPDFFWESAGRITASGWVLEMRIPFSSLRYSEPDPARWGVMLYRNYPRDFRYQMFTSRLPRDSTCFICNVRPLVGLAGLPSGSHWVVAPYAAGRQVAAPQAGLGTPLEGGDPTGDVGLDAKWLPNPRTAIDAAVNPDFSQIEADVAQIAANERFALFFPERRPFFLEGVDLFSTPLQAVYTRTFTQPLWGVRATGEVAHNHYTLLVGEDAGGGSVVLPGATSSDLAPQDFTSLVAIGRWRREVGDGSFVSFLYTDREIDRGGFNRVFGPDFRWQPSDRDTVSGQLLLSTSATPRRPDLADEWDGRSLAGHALEVRWYRQTETWDFFTLYDDIGEEFRADSGFIPQVGIRRRYGEVGYSFHPEDKPVSRLRLFTIHQRVEDTDGRLLQRSLVPGFGFDALWNSFVRLELSFDKVRGIDRVFERRQIRPTVTVRPGRVFSQLSLVATFGDEVDFANDRLGDGTTLRLSVNLRPTDHLQLEANADRRTLDVDAGAGLAGRLFTARVARLRAVYNFTSRSWLRLIGQWIDTVRRPELYTFAVDDHSGSLAGSAVFAYKLNWQTVLYVGAADNRALDALDTLQPAERQLFFKVSYAFQG